MKALIYVNGNPGLGLSKIMKDPINAKDERDVAIHAAGVAAADGFISHTHSVAAMFEMAPDGWKAWTVTDGFAHTIATVYTKP